MAQSPHGPEFTMLSNMLKWIRVRSGADAFPVGEPDFTPGATPGACSSRGALWVGTADNPGEASEKATPACRALL